MRTKESMLALAFFVNVALTAIGGGAIKVPGLKTNKEVSEKYTHLLTPKGWAFAIWSYIFVLEAASVVLQTFEVAADDAVLQSRLESAAPYLSSAFLIQGLWALAFGLEWLWISSALIIGLLGSLVLAVYVGCCKRDS